MKLFGAAIENYCFRLLLYKWSQNAESSLLPPAMYLILLFFGYVMFSWILKICYLGLWGI